MSITISFRLCITFQVFFMLNKKVIFLFIWMRGKIVVKSFSLSCMYIFFFFFWKKNDFEWQNHTSLYVWNALWIWVHTRKVENFCQLMYRMILLFFSVPLLCSVELSAEQCKSKANRGKQASFRISQSISQFMNANAMAFKAKWQQKQQYYHHIHHARIFLYVSFLLRNIAFLYAQHNIATDSTICIRCFTWSHICINITF